MRRNGKAVRKSDLPEKICRHCNRPFAWRKKWERDWDEVTCCSEACKAAWKRTHRTST
jgi:hypothetical protein